MTYLAPRQGLFAIIILVSFCLQTLLLVISTDQQLTSSREQKGEQMVAQLIDEARLSLENKDRVSLSVIANRYTSEQDVTKIIIKDENNEVLVPVGNAPMQQGDTVTQIATNGDAVIGSVALTLKDISKGEIITMQWPFVIGSMILHVLLWLLYGYIARPTKEQINALSHEIEDIHRAQYPAQTHNRHTRHSEITNQPAENNDSDNNDDRSTDNKEVEGDQAVINTANIHSELNAYLKSQQSGTDAINAIDASSSRSSDHTHDNAATIISRSSMQDATQAVPRTSQLSAHVLEQVEVQVTFHDDYKMLERLAPETRLPYLALCTQLLQQALSELLKQPLLVGVTAVNEPYFDGSNAVAILRADNSHAKVALAGVMLGKLYLMLNKIIHDKHIELSRFALPVKVGVSDSAQSDAMTQLLKSVGKKEQLLILLPSAGVKQISNHVKVHNLERPTTVYERECAIFEGGNEVMMQRLADVRNAVLTH